MQSPFGDVLAGQKFGIALGFNQNVWHPGRGLFGLGVEKSS